MQHHQCSAITHRGTQCKNDATTHCIQPVPYRRHPVSLFCHLHNKIKPDLGQDLMKQIKQRNCLITTRAAKHPNNPRKKVEILVLFITSGKTFLPWLPADLRRKIYYMSVKCLHGCGNQTFSGLCCYHSDLRVPTKTGLYPAYIDGHGNTGCVSRNAYYCPKCKYLTSRDLK